MQKTKKCKCNQTKCQNRKYCNRNCDARKDRQYCTILNCFQPDPQDNGGGLCNNHWYKWINRKNELSWREWTASAT